MQQGHEAQTLEPVAERYRILSLDAVRGLAVLGILAVNVVAFSLPYSLEMAREQSPFPLVGDNAVALWVIDVFFRQKFVTLFSMLFGVSIWLVGGERSDLARGKLLRRRLFWLAIFGLLHGLAFWYGDILLLYAWAGLFVMLTRSMKARSLMLIGGAATLALATLQALSVWTMAANPDMAAAGGPMVADDAVADAIARYQAGWASAMIENAKAWLFIQGMSLFGYVFSTVPLMMLGMGLFKAGFFSGHSPRWIYLTLIAVGGVYLALLGLLQWLEMIAGPEIEATGGLAAAVASFPVLASLAYASLIVLSAGSGLRVLVKIFAPVGRMAFSNYLLQTLIMTTIFYMPWGPRLYGQVDFVGQWMMVAGVWAFALVWSPLWLSRFRMGPLEWVWRRLSYGRRLPLSKAA